MDFLEVCVPVYMCACVCVEVFLLQRNETGRCDVSSGNLNRHNLFYLKFKSHQASLILLLESQDSDATYKKVKLKVCLCRLKQEVRQTDGRTEVLSNVCFSSSNISSSCRCDHNLCGCLFLSVRTILSVLKIQRCQKSTNSFPSFVRVAGNNKIQPADVLLCHLTFKQSEGNLHILKKQKNKKNFWQLNQLRPKLTRC